MIYKYEKTITIKKEYIDMNGHVNNVVFLQLMQDVAIEHSDANGYTIEKYKELNRTWIAKKHSIEYLKPVYLEDTIKIVTWIETISRSFGIRKYEFFNTKDNSKVCKGESTWVYIDTKKERPCKIDDDLKRAFLPN